VESRRTSIGIARRRRLRVLGIASAILGLALCAGAAPASAIIAKIAGHAYGITPIQGVSSASIPGAYKAPASRAAGTGGVRKYAAGGALISHGGPVMHSVKTHAVYWEPPPSKELTATTKGIINRFFADVAHDSGLSSNVFGVAGQYTDATGNAAYSSSFEGERVDIEPYPANGCEVPAGYSRCLLDEQVTEQLSAYIEKNKLPTGPAQQYFVIFPHKVVTCFPKVALKSQACSSNVFCAYHGVEKQGTPEEIIYSDIPTSLMDKTHAKACQSDGLPEVQEPNADSTGFADVALKYISHEYIEASTDPQGEGWFDAAGREIGDKCNSYSPTPESEVDPNAFLPTLGGEAGQGTLFDQAINADHFYIQSEWDNGANACSMKPVPLEGAGFTPSSSSPFAGASVSFSGTAVDAYKGLGFSWAFGDGASGEGAAPTHVYAAPGAYRVTMTAKDSLTGATAPPAERTIVVNDQPTAAFTASPNPATPGSGVGFNGSASSDPDGSIVTYSWQFGDGGTGGGVTPSHAYAGAGTYVVTLTATDSAGVSATTTQPVTIDAAHVASLAANGEFSFLSATVNERTGTITFTASVADSGTFSWLLRFQNGRFGVFAAKVAKCKAAYVRLSGRCRPARVVFAKGSKGAAAPGTVTFTIKPTASAWKALRNALKRRQGVPVEAALTFQSARGGSPVTHTQRLSVKLKRK
jgi:PKD repeat protein